ncbi:GNAT family N-acetyltransferase [Luteimonas sp BLCC-B24]|uniref:GNAT family N-acetyltransferase n=1 Tax=Luteimonas sp. BLCC-B24 TaxID=3025317 RepID=UPI00234D8459|nr:GNAT family N-acetyltransferase [Luteimonas sp. BLCC-B24]MDC7808308.1 GNAT family N-acetyltransferase [Luteimonas sp. BLCC-B24]
MRLSLQPADDQALAFCESLNRRNMAGYLAARGISWDSSRFLASWVEFENLMILAESQVVGLLRLVPEQDALGLRDLQIVPEHQGQGIGSWAVQQAQSIAASRGYRRLQLRVYEENPAKAMYARLGFKAESVVDGSVHMACELPPNNSFKPTPLRGAA